MFLLTRKRGYIMKIYIVEKESNTGDGFWQNDGIIPCINEEVAKREMRRMIKETSEGDFEFSENNTVAISKNGWVRISFYKLTVVE